MSIFLSSKTKPVGDALSKTKSKKVYDIRIRKYQIIDKKKTYGAWSTVKKINVK